MDSIYFSELCYCDKMQLSIYAGRHCVKIAQKKGMFL